MKGFGAVEDIMASVGRRMLNWDGVSLVVLPDSQLSRSLEMQNQPKTTNDQHFAIAYTI
jgi:hypothetical protein